MPGEVTISVLITDLVGSTELSTRLGPDGADQLRRDHFASLRQAVAATGGREVKNLGDGLMVVYPSVTAVVEGAIALQQAVDRANRLNGTLLEIRVGLAHGDAVHDDDDYFGAPVVEAARFCAAAVGGQILAADLVRALQRGRDESRFRSVGALQLKGFPEPIETIEIRWAPRPVTDVEIPFPAALRHRRDFPVVGREAEQQRLADAVEAARRGDGPALVLVSGEPGIGKTTVVGEVCLAAHAGGAIVLLGRCDEDLEVNYRPFVEAISHYVRHASEAVVVAMVSQHGRELVRLVPSLGARIAEPAAPMSDPEAERYLLFGAVTALLAEASAHQPLVLVMDDLHWADRSTLVLLKYVLSTAELAHVVVLATYRDTDLTPGHPLLAVLADLNRNPRVERMALDGLDHETVAALVRLSGSGGEEDLARAVYDETAGNPFFVTEVLLHLSESGLGGVGLPDTVREVVARRVRRLGPAAERLLATAAVIGREFDLDVLTGVVEDTRESEAIDLIEGATAAQLVSELPGRPDRYQFTHALTQHTLHDDLSSARRRRIHRRVAEVLEERVAKSGEDRVAELARHWYEGGGPDDWSRVLDHVCRAGERALDDLAPDEAERWYLRGLELIDRQAAAAPHGQLRAEVLIGLGEAQRRVGDPAFRQTLLAAADLARAVGDADRLARAVLANTRGFASAIGRVDRERVAALEAALDLAAPASSERALILAWLALEHGYDSELEARRRWVGEALAIARRLDEGSTLARLALPASEALRNPATLAARRAMLHEALEAASRGDDPATRFWVTDAVMVTDIEAGDWPAARERLEVVRRLAAAVGEPSMTWVARWTDAVDALRSGDHGRAEQLAFEAYELGVQAGQADATAIWGGQLIAIRWVQGRLGELVDVIGQAAHDNPNLVAFRAALASALCACDRRDEAATVLAESAGVAFADVHDDAVELTTLVWFARVAVHLGATDAAAHLYDRLAPWHAQVSYSGATIEGSVAHELGALATVLGRDDDAERHFAEALALHQLMDDPFHVARTQLGLAELLTRRSGPEVAARVRELIESSAMMAERQGFAGLVRRAAALRAQLPAT